jgi:hypothetical protein
MWVLPVGLVEEGVCRYDFENLTMGLPVEMSIEQEIAHGLHVNGRSPTRIGEISAHLRVRPVCNTDPWIRWESVDSLLGVL